MESLFEDRKQAGQRLASVISEKIQDQGKSRIVVALPRGGLPIAFEIAKKLKAHIVPLIVRKIGDPNFRETAVGALVEDGSVWIDQRVRHEDDLGNRELLQVIEEEKLELARRVQLYRHGHRFPSVEDAQVILVDDGIATGSTMRVALEFLKSRNARQIIVAVPVCPPETARMIGSLLRPKSDQLITLYQPPVFQSVSQFYENFREVSDNEVEELLQSRF